MISMIIRLLILGISFFGFYLLLKIKFKIKAEFCPIIIFTTITALLYFGGLLNIMVPLTYFVYLSGLICSIYFLFSIYKKKVSVSGLIPITIFVFIAVTAYFFIRVYNQYFTHYDNFSHWGLIAKEIIQYNHLPNFQNTTILFQSYPPASACFIYYICKLSITSEAMMLFAQGMLTFAAILPIFAFAKSKSKILLTLLMTGTFLCFILLNNYIFYMLLVDTLLSCLGIAGWAIILYYLKDFKTAAILSIPITITLLMVKNSGIFFVLIMFCLLAYSFFKYTNKKKAWTLFLVAIILPLSSLYLWKAHINYVYPYSSAVTSKHAMSAENFESNLKSKTSKDKKEITVAFIKRSVDITDKNTILFLSSEVVYLVVLLLKNKKWNKEVTVKIVIYNLIYLIYLISVYGMYLLSMPVSEALYLAAFDRYIMTIIMFLYGVILIEGVQIDTDRRNIISYVIINGFVWSTLLVFCEPSLLLTFDSNYNHSIRQRFDMSANSIKENTSNKSFIVYIPDNLDRGYMYYMGKYILGTVNIQVVNDTENIEDLPNYDYLIVLNNDDKIKSYMEKENISIHDEGAYILPHNQ